MLCTHRSVALQTPPKSDCCRGRLPFGDMPHHVTSRAAQLATRFCTLDQQPLSAMWSTMSCFKLAAGPGGSTQLLPAGLQALPIDSPLTPCRLVATLGLLAGHTLSLTPPPQAGGSNQEAAAGQPADFQAAASHLLLWCLEVLGSVVGRSKQPGSDQSPSSMMDSFGGFSIIAGLVLESVCAGGITAS